MQTELHKSREAAMAAQNMRGIKKAREKLVGRTITDVITLNPKELEELGWDYGSPMALVLDDGNIMFPSMDDEGNGPGAMFLTYHDLTIMPVMSS